MSRIASVASLILYAGDRVYAIGFEGRRFGVLALLFALYLLNAVRATYWFNTKGDLEKTFPRQRFLATIAAQLTILKTIVRMLSYGFVGQCGKDFRDSDIC